MRQAGSPARKPARGRVATARERAPRHAAAPRLVFFTIVANNYLAYARTLVESIAAQHPASARYVFLCDEPVAGGALAGLAELVPARALGIDGFAAMAFAYDVMEFSTAIKPSCFLWLAARHPDAIGLIYLDPDILVTAPLEHVERALSDGASLVLTPHMTAPLQDGALPDDLTIMKSGCYNLGFAAFRMTPESRDFLGWWRDRCRRDAVVDIEGNRFTDQRWMDMAPCFVRGTHILHHHSYNLAYWNLLHRRVTRRGQQTLVDGEALRFVHFSGVNPADPTAFSKHQNRFTTETIGALRPLFEDYLARVVRHGWAEFRQIPYAYGRFISGRAVHEMMRRSFRRHEAEFEGDPFAGDGGLFDTVEPSLTALGPPGVTRVMYELWQRRRDLQRRLDIETPDGREEYLRWFGEGGGAEAGLDEASIAAAGAVLAQRETILPALLPWPPQAAEVFDGPRGALDAWLAEPVPLNVLTDAVGAPIPRQLALVWEKRTDLQQHFRNQSEAELQDFLLWCLLSGVAEGEVDLSLIAPSVASFMDAVEEEGTDETPPVTRLMRLLAPWYSGPFRQQVDGFPGNVAGRQAMAIWLAAFCSRARGWPEGYTGAVAAWNRARAPGSAQGGVPICRLLYAMWALRTDVREVCDLRTLEGQLRFCAWVICYGMREFDVPPDALPDSFAGFLAQPAPGAVPGFLRLHSLAWAGRADLRQLFDPTGHQGQAALIAALAAEPDDPWSISAWLRRISAQPPATLAPKVATSPARVVLTGLVRVASGRGADVRMTAAALRAHDVACAFLDHQSGEYSDADGASLPAGALQPAINIVHCNADTAMRDYLFLRRNGAARPYAIGFWAWELARLPAEWNTAFAFYDEIWASTRFACEAFRAASPRPVTLMPMAVELPATDPALGRGDFGLPDDAFLFYFGFDFRSYVQRKNPEAALAAFREAFPRGDEKVALVVKTLAGEQHAAELETLLKLAGGDPRVIVRDREYDARALATLVSLCDCFVSLHRSEGFGRGPAEAMLLGKPVIATDYSGNVDFMDAANSLLVDYRLIPVPRDAYPGWLGQEWADPDPSHAAAHMRHLVSDPEFGRRLGEAARRTIRTSHSAAAVGARMLARLQEIGGLGARRAAVPATGRRRRARAMAE
ncbi:MAG TPA: glycosyltransferase family 4 protein [Acetobacteraceae bacterium]|nr:glycosyltransferase family 4 protein [Acetobacteraceae bacterium]